MEPEYIVGVREWSQRLWCPCDYCVTPVPIGLRFRFGTALGLGLGLRGPDLGLGLDNKIGILGLRWHI